MRLSGDKKMLEAHVIERVCAKFQNWEQYARVEPQTRQDIVKELAKQCIVYRNLILPANEESARYSFSVLHEGFSN